MRQKRLLIFAAVEFCIIMLGVVILVTWLGRRDTGNTRADRSPDITPVQALDSQEDITIARFAQDSEYNKGVRAEIQGNLPRSTDNTGVVNYIVERAGYTPESPLVEILPKVRDLDGQVKSLQFEALSVKGIGTPAVGYFDYAGKGLRLQIDSGPVRGAHLLYDTEYRVEAAYVCGEGRAFAPSSNDPPVIFKTPAMLDEGEIYRVELILLDRVAQARKEKEERLAKEEHDRLVKEEVVTIDVQYPPDVNDGFCEATYVHKEVTGTRTGDDRGTRGTVTIAGPNPLGGELQATIYTRHGTSWKKYYLSNLQKRKVRLPQDAEIIYAKEDAPLAYFDVADRELAISRGFRLLAFYHSRDSRLPLFSALLQPPVADVACPFGAVAKSEFVEATNDDDGAGD